ncbi:hypothetical protein DBR39_13835 [Chryseobacterium sp. KBW03]|nr:hypothetical protein DBR39_13835 [Chryseobacterium sp. KBW03]
MTTHEKALKIINDLGMSAAKIAEILGKSQSTAYDKIKSRQYNKFSDIDFETIKTFCVEKLKEIKKL